MTFFSGSNISPEKYPISERQNAVFPTIPDTTIHVFCQVLKPDSRTYNMSERLRQASGENRVNNGAALEQSAEDRSDPCAGRLIFREACFKSPETRFISPETKTDD